MSRKTSIIVAAIGTGLMMAFVIGLSHSISTGFAGFWCGLPFMVITIIVIALAIYNFWEDTVMKKDD